MKKYGGKLTTAFDKIIKNFNLGSNERLLLVTDSAVTPKIREAMSRISEKYGAKVITTAPPERSAQPLGEEVYSQMEKADAILYVTSQSRTHSPETTKLLREKRARFYSITNATPEVLLEGASKTKISKVGRLMYGASHLLKGAERFHMTSENGTNLEVGIKNKRMIQDSGRVYGAGKMANFPFGEYMSAVDLKDTHGTLIIDGAITGVGQVDRPVKVEIERGIIRSISGGESAQKLKAMLDKAQQEYKKKNPDGRGNAYAIAEFGIGMNPGATRYVAGRRISPKTSLEAEKMLGTYHIGFGNNKAFKVPDSDPDYNDIGIHIDCVELNPTIIANTSDGKEIKVIEKGRHYFRETTKSERETESHKKSKSLEGRVLPILIVAVCSLIFSILFSSHSFTGYAILNVSEKSSNFMSIIFFIAGLIVSLLYLKNRK